MTITPVRIRSLSPKMRAEVARICAVGSTARLRQILRQSQAQDWPIVIRNKVYAELLRRRRT